MADFLPFCDSVTLSIKPEFRDSLKASYGDFKDSAGKPALEIVIDATHGGYKNRNGFMYLPEGQKKSVHTWVKPYGKPVLDEHDMSKPPHGRVTAAEFIQIAEVGDINTPKSVVRLTALITDKDTIEKIIDGRYQTVSTRQKPVTAPICSICTKPISMFGCDEHDRNQKYDDKVCYYMFDEMEYAEVSFVNRPADQTDNHAAMVHSMKVVTVPTLMDAVTTPEAKVEDTVKDNETPETPKPTDATPAPTEPATPAPATPAAEPAPAAPAAEPAPAAAPAAPAPDAAAATEPVVDTTVVDAKRENYLAEAAIEGGHSHRLILDPATGNGWSDYILGHSHSVVNKSVQPAAIVAPDAPAEAVISHTHVLGKKIDPLADSVVFIDQQVELRDKAIISHAGATKEYEREKAEAAEKLKAADARHDQDIKDQLAITKSYKDALAKTLVILKVVTGKSSALDVLGGKNQEERQKSFSDKVAGEEVKTLEALKTETDGLFQELTAKVLVQPVDQRRDHVKGTELERLSKLMAQEVSDVEAFRGLFNRG